MQQIPALGCARLNPAYFSWLHELSALKGNNVLGLKFEPFAILALCLEAPVPVGFDADGVVGSYYVNSRGFLGMLCREFSLSSSRGIASSDLVEATRFK